MSIGLLFSGQGAQHVSMGKSLYDNNASIRALWDKANDVLGFDLKKIAFDGPEDQLTQTKVCQPALYLHGYSVYTLLQENGKLADIKAVLGLSLGELTALAVAGVYDFETGLQVVAKRGALMQEACEQSNGAMASILGGDAAKVQELCDVCDVDIANLNCPGQIVISGEASKIATAVGQDQPIMGMGRFRKVVPLNVAGAYHSRLMQPAADAFGAFLADVELKSPQLAVFTNVTGKQVSNPAQIKAYLVKQVVSAVRWEDCMNNAAAVGVNNFFECGPGKVLKGLARRINDELVVSAVSEYQDIQDVF